MCIRRRNEKRNAFDRLTSAPKGPLKYRIFRLKLDATRESLAKVPRRVEGEFSPWRPHFFSISLLRTILLSSFFCQFFSRRCRDIYFCCCCCCCSISSLASCHSCQKSQRLERSQWRFHVDQLLFVSVVNHKRWMASQTLGVFQSLDIFDQFGLTIASLLGTGPAQDIAVERKSIDQMG